jgi:DMSO reductase anchor subunit
MRPAYSVILFTTLSGAGYGVLGLLGGMLVAGAAPRVPALQLAVGLALTSVGLVASTLHLGRPERAWRALSQWRTSWLSREGVAALAVYAAALPLGALLLGEAGDSAAIRLLAGATALLALATVCCTAMIYASLRPVPQWRHPTVPAAYILLALASGGLFVEAVQRTAGDVDRPLALLLLLLLAAAWAIKEAYWRAKPALPTRASATGLAALGDVLPLDPPHTESNYLLREFGYRVARRHASRLRQLARAVGFALPIGCSLGVVLLPGPQVLQAGLAVIAALAAMVGILAERWLFFAEARHTVMLYYRDEAP